MARVHWLVERFPHVQTPHQDSNTLGAGVSIWGITHPLRRPVPDTFWHFSHAESCRGDPQALSGRPATRPPQIVLGGILNGLAYHLRAMLRALAAVWARPCKDEVPAATMHALERAVAAAEG